MPRSYLLELRSDTAGNWTSVNPILEAGEPGYDSTNKQIKIGDGLTRWTGLQGVGSGTIESFVFSMSGLLSMKPGASRLYLENFYGIESIRASVNTPSAGAAVKVDVMKNNVSIYTGSANQPTIPPGTYTVLSSVPATIFVPGDMLTVSVVQVGSTDPGADLTVTIRLRRLS